MSANPPKTEDYFKGIHGNLTKLTWKHAVNNKALLNTTLASSEYDFNITRLFFNVIIKAKGCKILLKKKP